MLRALVVAISFLSFVMSTGTLHAATLINGAGATFPYPLYSKWFSEYNKKNTNVQFNYQSIGSGGGIRQFLQKTVDFGATDAPMKDSDLAESKVGILHVPTVMGAVVVTYNLSGTKDLKLTGELVADIYLGKIKKWDDPKIRALNPKITSTKDILVVRRADGSGTTGIFTDYLAKVSADFKTTIGQGTAVNWPVGMGGKGNDGVTAAVKQTEGSIGYVELIYAESNQLSYATLKNSSGNFVKPSLDSVSASAEGVTIPEDFRVSLTDAKGKKAYPISGFTYLLVYQELDNTENKGKELKEFLKWAMKDGQKYAKDLLYSPLPKTLVAKVEAKIATIKVNETAKP